ncbi:2-oxoglutarate dehydrogenase E2 component (dihydrolipoamide succinyltransferase) [Methylomarinovum caldicuralii]|uniref:Dihydrolipoyllysine-residue succinyltransferase component of 2-oxoglutarate dehydrogenase complex n=1 Tax=Methylomarinovum caldicuralii TaxID=438856 RepID=A0AAU9CP28_9GAMM|nr:2-oxoglutarate dehydrogenase complex dihydrolipoyllysine-residue succinyltransferase [Methylomarinovum caldicuralii]BCX81698.1 2-oxoglutarate dehydrogenase E2 component (dihydrolipoamide succinyltransferase) [Methylomarinovum caldicuralii]
MEIRVPPLPESVTDATVAAWHKKPGEAVRRDEKLVDLETDKVVLEVPAPTDGTLKEIKHPQGDTVTSGEVLTVLEPGEVAVQAPTEKPPTGAPQVPPPLTPAKPEAEAQPPALSPSVRRLLTEHGLDAGQIPATGKGGRLTREDVLAYLERHKATAPAPPTGERSEQRVPMTRIRARIAQRLLEVQRNTAMLTTFNEVDLLKVMQIRKRHGEAFQKKHGVKLGFMSFFVKASVEALKAFPIVNASIDGEDIVYHGYFDIGIAVSTDRGLVVPILRDADRLGFADIEKQIDEFARKAREGSLALEDLQGGTFTITNGGIFGSLLSTPLLNPPQSAILGMHAIKERPVAVDGEVVIRPMMYLALTYDHRLIDGREAVLFLRTVKEILEAPERLFLGI